jgi:hypothetical protein
VTAHVTAETPERAAEIAWNGERVEGEFVEYQQEMSCFDPDGPEVAAVFDLGAP